MPKLSIAEIRAVLDDAKQAYKAKFTPGFYHGSPTNKITAFDPSKSAVKDLDMVTPGVTFVSPNPRFAEKFLADPEKLNTPTGATMYPVSVNLGKHFDPATPEGNDTIKQYLANKYKKDVDSYGFDEALGQKHEYMMDRLTDPVNNWKLMESPELLNFLKSTGHDTFSVTEGGVKNVGIFNPANIRGKFAQYNPEEAANPDFMKAEGGAVQSFAPGGIALAENIVKHSIGQHPKVAQALEEYLKGNISNADRIRIMNEHLPIRNWTQLPPAYTDEEIRNALMANKQPKALADVPAGMRVGNRLDIPAYTQHGVYVDTTHDLSAGNAPISYNRTGHLTDVEFSSKPNQAVRVGLGTKEQALTPLGAEIGSAKSPFALIKGTNVGTSDDEVRRMMAEMMQDPAYTQIGMDPRRHSQFYDKSTGLPVWSAEEKLQSGPLIIAPKQGLETTNWEDPRLSLSDFEGKHYDKGGAVIKKVLKFAEEVPFVHYSSQPNLTSLEPSFYGRGIKGQEAARLKDAPDIRNRSYFYVDKGEQTMRPEQGLGNQKYQGTASNVYNLVDDPEGFHAIAKAKSLDPYMMSFGREVVDPAVKATELERLIKGAGYEGYHTGDVGLLFNPTPVTKVDGYAPGGEVLKKLLPFAEREANKTKFLEGNHPAVPDVVYHGTSVDEDFNAFKKKPRWIHVTEHPEVANTYTELGNDQLAWGESPRVMPLHLSTKNPLILDDDQLMEGSFLPFKQRQREWIDLAKQQGNDSIYNPNTGTWMVPEPTQLKSAIGNEGTFNPTNRDITKKRGGLV